MERALDETRQATDLAKFIELSNKDPRAEFEAKVLAGRIQTRDVASRIIAAIKKIAPEVTDEHRLTVIYPDNIRVHVLGVTNIHKMCVAKSFKNLPVDVERKTRYFEDGEKDTIDVPDFFCRFTLKSEKHLKKDFNGDPDDPKAQIRMIHRQSYSVPGGEFRIDMSMVKTKASVKDGIREVLKNQPFYELEVEYTPRKDPRPPKEIMRSLYTILEALVGAYQETHHILPLSDLQRYAAEFKASSNMFYNPITLERRHIVADRPNNILKGYTVTNKADGQRCGLYVTRDKRLLRVNPNGQVVFTGITARGDAHVNDFFDGEYLPSHNLFCIFDVYRYKGRDVKSLPLFTTDEDILKNPGSSRLGTATQFIRDIPEDFVKDSESSLRIDTKMFLAGDGAAMEEAIRRMLDTQFEYETDGLIFTPRSSPVAPLSEVKGKTWLRIYKWKPPHQNSIDFLVKFEEAPAYDVNRKQMVKKGALYVGRTPGVDILYPCETLTGEYVPPKLPQEFLKLGESGSRVPSVFQPAAPRDPDAYIIKVPLNDRNVPADQVGDKVDDNTIVECTYDTDKREWTVMRTRYDKTYRYRVLGQAEYGNDINVADSIWTSIHVPITEAMLKSLVSSPPDDTFEDDMYYRDDVDSRDRILKNVYGFHNRIKEDQYNSYVVAGNTLLELAVGRGGDMHKWRRSKPAKVLGLDISLNNLSMPRQGACVRYLQEKKRSNEYLPKVLYAQGDMTKPFEEQESKYLQIVFGNEPATTPYLAEFRNIQEWDLVACQFALHYACESEEMFKTFVGNLKHCRSVFFGTFLDGKAVYTLLAGKDRHTFRSQGKTFAEITKKYTDDGEWKDEFGQQIDVLLESIVKPTPEYLVPFESVLRIMKTAGFEPVDSKMFGEIYTAQSRVILEPAEQEFSFLYRTFAFKRVGEAKTDEEIAEAEKAPAAEEEEEEEEEVKIHEEEAPKAKEPVRRKKITSKEPLTALPDILFFFSKEPENKELSNFYETNFKIDGVEYKSAEHAFEAIKAKTFGDDESFEKILKAKSAQSAKSFGNKVKDFKEDTWAEKQDEVMKSVVRAKFTQNLELRKKLLETEDKLLANADSRDKYWGIGTSANTSIAKDPKKWKGENKLGKMLEELRTQMKAE
uniref:mRNA (guanine-N(7))-methyltransferase n=1 Tax=viral metagenome TaxID=1070528 RepID=A0A6C0AIK2_9ZZZZ